MATPTLSDLETALEAINLGAPIPTFPSADVLNRPLDIYRSYLADTLTSLTECDPTAVFNSIKLSNDPLHGDFTVVLPQMCPGTKPKDLAPEIVAKVGASRWPFTYLNPIRGFLLMYLYSFQADTHSLLGHGKTVSTSDFVFTRKRCLAFYSLSYGNEAIHTDLMYIKALKTLPLPRL